MSKGMVKQEISTTFEIDEIFIHAAPFYIKISFASIGCHFYLFLGFPSLHQHPLYSTARVFCVNDKHMPDTIFMACCKQTLGG